MRLLLIEDDRGLSAALIRRLRDEGYLVDHAGDGVRGQQLGEQGEHDLAVLDIGLPGRNGLDVLRNWRAAGNTLPVLILTARDGWRERVEGLRAGADDYLGKPFEADELLARIDAIVRRYHGRPSENVEHDGLLLDVARRSVEQPDGSSEMLTETEFRLLQALMLNAGRVVARERLIAATFEDGDQLGNSLEVYVRRLRKKIGAERILTRRGQGYLMPRLHGESP